MKQSTIAIIGAMVIAVGMIALALFSSPQNSKEDVASADNVKIENGVQVVEITASGGYSPRKSLAKANTPTVIKFKTDGTFDCSIAVRIQKLGISKQLPPTGSTEVDIGTQPVGKLRGSCAMGMYPFEITFQ